MRLRRSAPLTLCNAGVVCAPARDLFRWLRAVRNDNAKGEYYLTDIVALATAEGVRVAAVEAPEAELRGINSRVELAEAEAEAQRALRRRAMEGGATLIQPESVVFSFDTRIGQDVTIGPHVVFGPGVVVEDGAEINAFTHMTRMPHRARRDRRPLRPPAPRHRWSGRAACRQLRRAEGRCAGAGREANHLSYLGDAEIGAGATIGAGTITCNYDGVHKHRDRGGGGRLHRVGHRAGRAGAGRRAGRGGLPAE
jgi:bifunctional UDP-N-acetylglucosamine pyrophosphorylase/glucosamine-1-phosphate N-acetyltransferase